MTLSALEMQHALDKTTIYIEVPDHVASSMTNGRYERSFSEILNMSSTDMAHGYLPRKDVVTKAKKLHAKLISSIILSTLTDHQPGYQSSERRTLSWRKLKKDKLWLTTGIQLGSKPVHRLDWVIHQLLISDTDSVRRWIESVVRWESFQINEDEGLHSDLEFHASDKRLIMEVEIAIMRQTRFTSLLH